MDRVAKLIPRVPRFFKYQRQLLVLSRLRKLSGITQKVIDNMPIHIEIETDDLYLVGIEKGVLKKVKNRA